MAKVVGDIAIQVGADIGPLVRDLGKGSAAVGRFGGSVDRMSGGFKGATVAATAVASAVVAAGTAVAALTKHAMDNIDAMSKQARAAGVSVTSFQAMAQVAEEAGVESDKLSSVLTKMQKNIADLQQGTQSQVDAFGRLGVSVTDLAGKNADEQFKIIAEALAAIEDPTTKTAAALDVFGKSGASVINMLDGYGAAIDNAAQFQRDFGIAVSDMDAQQIEAANDALGRLGMAMDGLGNSLAVAFAPSITAAAESLTGFIANLNSASTELNAVFTNAERAKSVLGDDLFNSLLHSKQGVEDHIETLKDLNYTYGDLQRTVHTTAEAIANEAPNLLDVGADELAIQLVDVGAKMDQVVSDFNAGKIGAEEMKKQLNDATLEAQRLLEEASKIDGVDMGSAIGQVGLLSEALAFAANVAQALRASLPGASGPVDPGQSNDKAQSLADRRAGVNSPLAPTSSPRPQSAPFFDGVSGGGRGGGGGGGGDNLQAKLDQMRADFESEFALQEEQYQSKLDQLKQFRDAKLLTEQEYNDLEKQITQEHQQSLAEIEQTAMQAKLSAVSGAFGDLSSLMSSSNKKLFKIGQAAAIAQATVDGYSAAVSAWEKGMKIGGPPLAAAFTAASLARTGALIAGIASQNSSGGGGGRPSAGGGSAPAASAQAAPSTYFNVSLTGGDNFGKGQVRDLISAINKEIENGAVIKGIKVN